MKNIDNKGSIQWREETGEIGQNYIVYVAEDITKNMLKKSKANIYVYGAVKN